MQELTRLSINEFRFRHRYSIWKYSSCKAGCWLVCSKVTTLKYPIYKQPIFFTTSYNTTPLYSTIVLFLLELETPKVYKLYYWSSFKIMATALVTWTERLSQPEESRSLSWMFGSLHTYTKIIVKLHWWHLGEHLHNRVGSMNCK